MPAGEHGDESSSITSCCPTIRLPISTRRRCAAAIRLSAVAGAVERSRIVCVGTTAILLNGGGAGVRTA